MSQVVEFKPWVTVGFKHFVGIRHRNGPWTNVFLNESGFEIDLQKLGLRVELSDGGIEFLDSPSHHKQEKP